MKIRPLSPELAEKARQELNEDPKRIGSDLQHIKDWIEKQPHLNANTDDQWLIAFLRGCKYSLERTKEKLDLYYSLRTIAPDLYRINHNAIIFKEILELGPTLVLPKSATPTSPRVSILRAGACDPEKHNIFDTTSVTTTIHKLMLLDDDTIVVCGIQSVVDMEGVTMAHFLQVTPTVMKKLVVHSQDALPVRVKGSHLLNTPAGFETVFNAAKSLLNDKNKNRIYVHNKNYEELYKHVPREVLPVEYGGEGGTIREIIEYWKRKIDERSGWLDDDLKYGTDESKRPGQPKTAEGLFGVDGSFRQLEFD